MRKKKQANPAHQPENMESMLKIMLDACGDAIEENLPDCGFIVILAATGNAADVGTMRYLSNLTKESRDHLLSTILSGEEPPPPPVTAPPTLQ